MGFTDQHLAVFTKIGRLRNELDGAVTQGDQQAIVEVFERLHAALRELDQLTGARRPKTEQT